MINRHGPLILYRVERPEQAARLPWFAQNPPEMTAHYMPVYIVVKNKQPYAAVCTHKQVAQDARDMALSPQLAKEIAPLFEPVKVEFERPGQGGRGGPTQGYAALQQAVHALEGGGGGEEGGVAVEEPPEAVPPSRLALGGPRPKTEPKGVNPLAGMREMTPGDVDTVISGARGEQDPAKAKALRQQALSMMAQESKKRGESRAQCWVRHLLS
jgi:hypothetical protein